VTGFPGDVQDQAIGKTQRRPGPKRFQGCGDDIRILEHEVAVAEQLLNRTP
jgi:hypothetical protein